MPLSITENQHFRHFLSVADSKYLPVCRRTMTSKFPPLAPWDKKNTVPRGHGKPWLGDPLLVPVVSWPALGQLERAENQCSVSGSV
ncbi:hypothetical protein SKAU_G00069180 [Synaphobranchus kaupii]|uniref:Uncharacterized protein n=1 Tax=Synaphobranchus kaupii TaxID=118154 RepID=A0A9Q1JB42_SYNKA|nr:hypothetical protein SKAU_G00069180 [Synaphobranchus kaupii]